MYEQFTDRARKILQLAHEEARQRNHEYIGTEHLLLGMMIEEGGVAGVVLRNLGLSLDQVRADVERLVQAGPKPVSSERLPQTPRLKKLIEVSLEEARSLNHNYVGTEHLILALPREPDCLGAQILSNLGFELNDIRAEVLSLLGHELDGIPESEPPVQPASIASDYRILRILDAAANRATEGLRVVEDFTRFVLDDRYLTRFVKELRHEVAEALATLPREDRHALRDTQHDVGTEISTPAEMQRANADAVCAASCERVKQSLRSLEEFSKTIAPKTSGRLETLRYRFYTLEKALTTRLRFSGELAGVKLCVLIDGSFTAEMVRNLIAAGVGMIQLRDKNLSDRELEKYARELVGWVLAPTNCRHEEGGCEHPPYVIINDRPDIASAVNADGVHLGQDDLSVKAAREILGPRKLIGVSTHSIEQARQAVLDGANYIGVGPTFPSTTKQFEAFPGTALLKQVAEEISLPAFAIGGITLQNLPEVLATGIKRVAVGGAIAKPENAGGVAREFNERLRDNTTC
jgi:thiamine-phosphate pyrophosphorylase